MRGDQWKAVSAQSSLLHCVSIFTPYYHIINAEDPIGLTPKTLARRGEGEGGERRGGGDIKSVQGMEGRIKTKSEGKMLEKWEKHREGET